MRKNPFQVPFTAKKIKATPIPPRNVRYDPKDIQDFIDRCKGHEDSEAPTDEEPEGPVDPTKPKS